MCVLAAERRGSGKHEAESHDQLIQRIEIDVVRSPVARCSSARPSCLLHAKHQGLFSPQQVLNCTLDDIEVFMSRLQKAAEAFSQLNHRNKSKKNKKKGPAGLSPCLLMQWNEVGPSSSGAWVVLQAVLRYHVKAHYDVILLLPIIYFPIQLRILQEMSISHPQGAFLPEVKIKC